jgi:hypothetical protein
MVRKDKERISSLSPFTFTCKSFSTQKALHVKIQITLIGANDGDEIKVA